MLIDLDDDGELDWDGIHARARTLLHERGPRDLAELLLGLRDEGFRIPSDAVVGIDEELMNDDELYDLRDRRYCHRASLIEGRWFAHWLQQEEVADGILPMEPDFSALAMLGRRWTLPDGGRLEILHIPERDQRIGRFHRLSRSEGSIVAGPPGWLDAQPGDHVAVRVNGGRAEVQVIAEWRDVVATCRQVQAARRAFDHSAWYHGVARFDDVIMNLLLDEPQMLRDRALCLGDLLSSAHLRHHDEVVMWADIPPELYDLADARASGTPHGVLGCEECGDPDEILRQLVIDLGGASEHQKE